MATPWPDVRSGATGEDVRTIQHLLGVHGHPVTVDGDFGPRTRAAVTAFQTASGLVADGIVGSRTWPKLIVTVAAGASGARVRAVQGQLAGQGWRLAVDGGFGPRTTRAIRDFQFAHGLEVDAEVDASTWNALVADFARLGSPEAAAEHLFDAWGDNDRERALRNATQAAVDLLLRGDRGSLQAQGCSVDPVLGPDEFICSYTFEGGAVNLRTRGTPFEGFYVESAFFVAD